MLLTAERTVTAEIGSIDLRGFEIVRGQFFGTNASCQVCLTTERFRFNTPCLQKLNWDEIVTTDVLKLTFN